MTSTATSSTTTLVRPVGAVERLFYRYAERNPAHHSIVAEFDVVLGEDQVRTALNAVQERHPLLSAHVEDRPATRLGFYRADTVAPIELAVYRREDARWQSLAAEELRRPFDRSTAPLMRAVLMNGPSSSAILLTFEHAMADGISAVMVVRDLVSALNGNALPALSVLPAQEDVIRHTLPSEDELAVPELRPRDPRMFEPGLIRTFDGAVPHVSSMAMSNAESARLLDSCRTERTTVPAAIVTAAARVHGRHVGGDYVRAGTPINIRALIGVGGDCGNYFVPTSTGMAPLDGSPFWTQAREVSGEIAVARSAYGIVVAARAAERGVPVDAEVQTAEQFITGGLPFEMLISNLGVQDLDGTGSIRPTALWGPLTLTQIDGEYMIGVVTYQGRLRMTICGYAPTKTFLDDVRTTLVDASGVD